MNKLTKEYKRKELNKLKSQLLKEGYKPYDYKAILHELWITNKWDYRFHQGTLLELVIDVIAEGNKNELEFQLYLLREKTLKQRETTLKQKLKIICEKASNEN